MHSGSSKIYKKQSSVIRSVHDLNSFSMLIKTPDGTTNDCWESRIQLNSECPLVRLGKRMTPSTGPGLDHLLSLLCLQRHSPENFYSGS